MYLIASSKQFKFLFYLLYKKLEPFLYRQFKKSGDNTFCAHWTWRTWLIPWTWLIHAQEAPGYHQERGELHQVLAKGDVHTMSPFHSQNKELVNLDVCAVSFYVTHSVLSSYWCCFYFFLSLLCCKYSFYFLFCCGFDVTYFSFSVIWRPCASETIMILRNHP